MMCTNYIVKLCLMLSIYFIFNKYTNKKKHKAIHNVLCIYTIHTAIHKCLNILYTKMIIFKLNVTCYICRFIDWDYFRLLYCNTIDAFQIRSGFQLFSTNVVYVTRKIKIE
jgi:hypothetical protein